MATIERFCETFAAELVVVAQPADPRAMPAATTRQLPRVREDFAEKLIIPAPY